MLISSMISVLGGLIECRGLNGVFMMADLKDSRKIVRLMVICDGQTVHVSCELQCGRAIMALAMSRCPNIDNPVNLHLILAID